jgi:hypothetical protein
MWLSIMSVTKQVSFTLLIVLMLGTRILAPGQESVSNVQLQNLIAELYTHPWEGADNSCSPMCWSFHYTPPMLKIIEIGPAAQNALLAKLNDPAIKDQAIILLGGLGDERAVGPIIDAMVGKDEIAVTANAQKINLAAMLALTNLTVAEVTWHRGGGIEVRKCSANPKECWTDWWHNNQATFTVQEIKQSRRYSNYPNYGIYKQQ